MYSVFKQFSAFEQLVDNCGSFIVEANTCGLRVNKKRDSISLINYGS